MLRRHLRGFNKSSTLADQVFDESAVCKWIGVPTSALYGGVWHGPGRSPSTSALRYPDVGLKHHRSEHSSGSAAWPCLLRGPHRRDRRKRRSFLKRERRATAGFVKTTAAARLSACMTQTAFPATPATTSSRSPVRRCPLAVESASAKLDKRAGSTGTSIATARQAGRVLPPDARTISCNQFFLNGPWPMPTHR